MTVLLCYCIAVPFYCLTALLYCITVLVCSCIPDNPPPTPHAHARADVSLAVVDLVDGAEPCDTGIDPVDVGRLGTVAAAPGLLPILPWD